MIAVNFIAQIKMINKLGKNENYVLSYTSQSFSIANILKTIRTSLTYLLRKIKQYFLSINFYQNINSALEIREKVKFSTYVVYLLDLFCTADLPTAEQMTLLSFA